MGSLPADKMQTSVPAVYIRGGTSKALFFHERDIPPAGRDRDRFLLRIMGSPDPMQIDGMGGTYPVTSKIAIIRPSTRADADVDFIFVQISVNSAIVDYDAGCGNISAGVGPFVINEGLFKEKRLGAAAGKDHTTQEIRIFQTGTQKVLVSHVPINESTGRFQEKGSYHIAGCPGSGAPILMDYRHTTGGAVGRGIRPTGHAIDVVEVNGREIEFTLCDVAHIIAFARASDFGLRGDEHPKSINQDKALIAHVREFRGKAAQTVGMCRDWKDVDNESPMLPMVALLSETPDTKAHVQSRLFLDNACHSAMAGAGATCTAACSRMPGSIVAKVMKRTALDSTIFSVHHPSGLLPVSVETAEKDSEGLPTFNTLSFVRTARYLFKGELFIPEDFDEFQPFQNNSEEP